MNARQLERIAAEYDRRSHNPNAAGVRTVYAAFCRELCEQFNAVLLRGIYPLFSRKDPYPNSEELFAGIESRVFRVYRTAAGDLPADHPLAALAAVPLNLNRPSHDWLRWNDVFRAVHDYFGHYGGPGEEHYSFGLQGELKAWRRHSRMFSPIARLALNTETVGQLAWFHYGPHLMRDRFGFPVPGDADYVPLPVRPFAPQKALILESVPDGAREYNGVGRPAVVPASCAACEVAA